MQTPIIDHLEKGFDLKFGVKFFPWMIRATCQKGQWPPPALVQTQDLALSPAAKGLHYGLEVFEGQRAFLHDQGPALFRPKDHYRRMARSAQSVELPFLSEEAFIQAECALIQRCKDLFPMPLGSVYLRPFLMGSTAQLGVSGAVDAEFIILASPMGPSSILNHTKNSPSFRVWVTPTQVRAWPGGMGEFKVAGNYAASVKALSQAKSLGFDNVLFLDGVTHTQIEELSGMNFFWVENGILKTPPLRGTILPGITRDTLIVLAKNAGIPTEETPISIQDLCHGLQKGIVQEVFVSGTGSGVVSVTELSYLNQSYPTPLGDLGTKLRKKLIDIQFGKVAPPNSEWILTP